MFFDGEGSSKRKVNLGGVSKRGEDKKDFLEKQRLEREKRQLEKLRIKSATNIQAFWRGTTSKINLKKKERENWDIRITSDQAFIQNNIHSLLRQFLFFFHANEDDSRFIHLSQIILSTPSQNTQTLDGPFLFQIRKLLVISLRYFLSTGLNSTSSQLALSLINTFTDPAIYVHTSLCLQTLNTLISHGLLHYIKKIILNNHPSNSQLLSTLFSISLRRFSPLFSPPPSNCSTSFIVEIFSIPHLTQKIPQALIQSQLKPALPVILSTAQLPQSTLISPSKTKSRKLDFDDLHKPSTEELEYILYNLLDQGSLIFDSSSSSSSAASVSSSYTKLLVYCLTSLPSDLKINDEVYTPITPQSPPKFSPSTLVQKITPFVSPSFLRTVLQNLPATPSNPALSFSGKSLDLSSFSSLFPESVLSTCHIIDILLKSSRFDVPNSNFRVSILNAISFSTHFVRRMWTLLSHSRELCELGGTLISFHQTSLFSPFTAHSTSSESSTTSGLGINDDFGVTLLIWARCYSQVLLTLDDQEFFNEQSFFKLEELNHMVFLLKRLVFRMYWNFNPSSSSSSTTSTSPLLKTESNWKAREEELRLILTTLLRELYDRNARRSFVPNNIWTVEDSYQAAMRGLGGEIDLQNPKISLILQNIPFVIPFQERVKIFRRFIIEDKREMRVDPFFGGFRVTIRRNYIFEDAFAGLNNLRADLKNRIRVDFVNQMDVPEAGVDGGGLFKDLITDLVKTAFDPRYALFLPASDARLYPNPSSLVMSQEHLRQFEFLGRILGKAIYEGILVELPLANFFLSKILGKYNHVNDLMFLDAQLHKNLIYLKRYEENVEDLALNFSVVENEFGEGIVRELLPGGSQIAVTNENRIRYIYLMAHYRLNTQIKVQSEAFLRGFSDMINPEWIRMFNQDELQLLISGSPSGIDMHDMKTHTVYSGGYNESHPTIKLFWEVVSEMTPSQQQDLMKFVTSCSRPPLLGFEFLSPNFTIHLARSDTDDPNLYLPTSSTCVNFLKLPAYTTKSILREKLLYAISSGAGFDLS